MAPIINDYNPDDVDESTLQGTGRGGMLSSGYLRDGPVESHLEPDEKPVFVLSNGKKGVSYEHLHSGDERRFVPGDGYRAFAVLTDSRVVFLIGDTQERGEGDHVAAVPMGDVEVVEHSSGVLASEVVLTTAADVRWTFPCRGDVDDAVAYLDEASVRWMDVERQLEAAREHVVAATEACEERAYDDAIEDVREAMAATDATRRAERELTVGGVPAIQSRVERMETRIADVRVRVLESRATHETDAAERHWRRGEYGAAHDAFTAAHDDYVEALAAGDEDFDGTKRLRDRLGQVERNLAALERAPVERADEFREQALETDDLEEQGDLLERALESYRSALELDWGRSAKRFDADTGEVRERVDAVARHLVEKRRRYASLQVGRGDDLADDGDDRAAAGCYREASDALSATVEPARELVPEAADALMDHLDIVESRLAALAVDPDEETADWDALTVESPTPGDVRDEGGTDGSDADATDASASEAADTDDVSVVESPLPDDWTPEAGSDSDDNQTPILDG